MKNIRVLLGDRKFLLAAPLVMVSLLTIIILALGGFKQAEQETKGTAINLTVPGARLKDEKGVSKMAMYEKAELDSMRLRAQLQKDSLIRMDNAPLIIHDTNVTKVNRKVAELKEILGRAPDGPVYHPSSYPTLSRVTDKGLASSDVDRLERMLRSMKGEGEDEVNPEMRELNKTLDKLIAVQQPSVVIDSGRNKLEALPVAVMTGGEIVSTLGQTGSLSGARRNRFYDLESSKEEEPGPAALIEATVPETQTLADGGLLRLELKTGLVVRGQHIPSGTALYGVTRLSNERLQVKISSIRCRDEVFPVSLQVVDMDGMAGIYEPGSLSRESIRESAVQGVGMIGPSSPDASLGGQAASAGIQMARSLAGKKVRQVRVSVKSGYKVFLEDMSQK